MLIDGSTQTNSSTDEEEEPQQQQQPGASTLFLVGRWGEIRVDPGVWGFGSSMGVLQYKVKDAALRLLQHRCSTIKVTGWVPGVGARPRLWRNKEGAAAPQQGLPQLEAGQKRR
ncbi:MAG: hypothetical protein WCO50_04825, partial [Synechococcus sp. ELA619]